jgi:hypothetical protein
VRRACAPILKFVDNLSTLDGEIIRGLNAPFAEKAD